MNKAVYSSKPQAQKAVVDALHQHNLTDDEDWVPDVAPKVAGHLWWSLHIQAQRMQPADLKRHQLAHAQGSMHDLKIWNGKSKTLLHIVGFQFWYLF